jgi:hypothetical protein
MPEKAPARPPARRFDQYNAYWEPETLLAGMLPLEPEIKLPRH